jgi:hypothetical protein
MKLTTENRGDVAIVRVGESRMMYPLLNEFSTAVIGLIGSATIGCLMDLYRQMNAAGGAVRLIGVQKRVETMLTMTGALNFLQAHPDEAGALASFGGAA